MSRQLHPMNANGPIPDYAIEAEAEPYSTASLMMSALTTDGFQLSTLICIEHSKSPNRSCLNCSYQ